MKKHLLLYALIMLSISFRSTAQNGNLDVSFGINGKVTIAVGQQSSEAKDIKVLADNKIILAGSAHNSGNNYDFSLARFNPDGTLDTTFGSLGKVNTDYNNLSNTIQSICILSSGKILAVGTIFYSPTQPGDLLFARYNADGTLDTSFGNNGLVVNDFEGRSDVPYQAVELPNGKILVTGESETTNSSKLITALYLPDMTLDPAFGTNGYYLSSGNSSNSRVVHAINNDTFLVGGSSYNGSSSNDLFVWKFNSNGTLDTNFGINGKASTDFDQLNDYIQDMKVLPNGKIILLGQTTNLTTYAKRISLARLNEDGTLDDTFGTNGKIMYAFDSSSNETPTSLFIRSNGNMVISCAIPNNMENKFGLLFLDSNGVPDVSYGTNGWVFTPFNGNDVPKKVAEQADGKIVAAGFTSVITTWASGLFAMARYETEVSLNNEMFPKSLNNVYCYPNPVKDQLTISYNLTRPDKTTMTLYDNKGVEISTKPFKIDFTNERITTINGLSSLAKGLYLLKVSSDRESHVLKILKD